MAQELLGQVMGKPSPLDPYCSEPRHGLPTNTMDHFGASMPVDTSIYNHARFMLLLLISTTDHRSSHQILLQKATAYNQI